MPLLTSLLLAGVSLLSFGASSTDPSLSSTDTITVESHQTIEQTSTPNRSSATVSNVLKTRHDTVKNSINNVR